MARIGLLQNVSQALNGRLWTNGKVQGYSPDQTNPAPKVPELVIRAKTIK